MPNKKVAILMSTYNGQQYLDSQIMSIINQSYNNWHLYIRDDGSSDGTRELIQEYVEKDKRISYFNAENDDHKNVGVMRSFMRLLLNTNADFYMFCDQDDFWLPDKVLNTLNCMLSQPYQKMPICVHTDLTVVNENLKGHTRMNGDRVWHDFYHLLFSNCVTGCTMMINQLLKAEVQSKEINYDHIYMHDWWFALIASAFGKVVYLNKPTMLYRQHGDNVVGSYESISLRHYLYRAVHQDTEVKRTKDTFNMINEFYRVYGQRLTGKAKKYVQEYAQVVSEGTPFTNLVLGIKFPPAKKTPKGKIFTTYLMTMYAKRLRH